MSNPLKQLKDLTDKWHLRTPKQKWLLIYTVAAEASEIIGVTVYGDLKIHWYTYVPGLFCLLHLTMILTTLSKYSMEGNYARGLECTCSSGMMIAVSFKMS